MKLRLSLRLSLALAVIVPSLHAGTAAVQLQNNSVRMNAGNCSCGFGLVWYMHFSTFFTEEPVYANREFAPLPEPGAYSHWSYMILEDPSMFASPTYAELNFPSGDVDGNGIADFFEVGQGVAAGSVGRYAIIWGSGYGQLQFQWTRAAGSRIGSCSLIMIDSILGQMGPFTHTFELVEPFQGTLTYMPGAETITGTLSVARSGQAAFTGPITLIKSETNRFNSLTLVGGQLSNGGQSIMFNDCHFTRHPAQPTRYSATLRNPNTAYGSWHLSVVDANDIDGDGIPDLSDDLYAPARPPTLALRRNGSDLQLQISGDIGRVHHIEQAGPNFSGWTNMSTWILSSDPQTIALPLPEVSPTYYRVRAE